MGKFEQSRSYLAQGIVEGLLDKEEVKNTPLFHKLNNKKVLNEKVLNLFLRVYSKNEELIGLLSQLNREGYHLPDLLCINPETKEAFFHEIKSENRKLKLSDIRKKQKEALKKLADSGYVVHITNIIFDKVLNDEEDAWDIANKEEGRSLYEDISKNADAKLKIRENYIKDTINPNIFIQEIEVL